MLYDTRTEHGVTIVTPSVPRLDASTATALREALIGSIDLGSTKLVLDLTGVAFVDSSALGALIAAAKRIRPDGHFGVAGVQPAVARLFALTHMDRVFSLHPSTAEAVARLTA